MKTKICLICHTAIDMDKEFCKLEHYEKKDIIKSKGYYHVICFKEKLSGSAVQKKLAEDAFKLLKVANRRLGVEEIEEVII